MPTINRESSTVLQTAYAFEHIAHRSERVVLLGLYWRHSKKQCAWEYRVPRPFGRGCTGGTVAGGGTCISEAELASPEAVHAAIEAVHAWRER